MGPTLLLPPLLPLAPLLPKPDAAGAAAAALTARGLPLAPVFISAADDAAKLDIAQPSMPLLLVATSPLPAAVPAGPAPAGPPAAAAAAAASCRSLVSWDLSAPPKASKHDKAAERTSAWQYKQHGKLISMCVFSQPVHCVAAPSQHKLFYDSFSDTGMSMM